MLAFVSRCIIQLNHECQLVQLHASCGRALCWVTSILHQFATDPLITPYTALPTIHPYIPPSAIYTDDDTCNHDDDADADASDVYAKMHLKYAVYGLI